MFVDYGMFQHAGHTLVKFVNARLHGLNLVFKSDSMNLRQISLCISVDMKKTIHLFEFHPIV